MTATPKHIIRTAELSARDAFRVRRPLNPSSDVSIQRLSEWTGMQRLPVNLARVPPGKESFALHAHLATEEFLYILEGRGTAVIGDAEIPVGPSDFMGFPPDGTPHHLKNTGTTDLVYLMGGERTAIEVARFPASGNVAVSTMADGARFFDDTTAEQVPFAAFLATD